MALFFLHVAFARLLQLVRFSWASRRVWRSRSPCCATRSIRSKPDSPVNGDFAVSSPAGRTWVLPAERTFGHGVPPARGLRTVWDDAAERCTFDLIRGLIAILVPFTSPPQPRRL